MFFCKKKFKETSSLKYISGFKYQVVEDFVLKIDFYPKKDLHDEFCILYKDGTLLIKKGFAWDGASGPTIDTVNSMIPSIVHDALYRMIRHGLLDIKDKDKSDLIFHDLLIKYGMNKIRAKYWYLGVKYYGKDSCTKPSRIIKINEKL